MENKMLLKNIDTAFIQDTDRSIEQGIDILIRDGMIDKVGEGLSTEDEVDCSEKIALPGLINCHTHTANIITRGWCDDKSLFPWLEINEHMIEQADRTEKRAAARLSAALLLETGTTTLNDMWNTYLADDLAATGIRSYMGGTMTEFEETDPDLLKEGFEHNRAFIKDYQNHRIVHPTIPVHSVYRATDRLLQTAHDIATTHDIPFHIHVSETQQENRDCRREYGTTSTGRLEELDILQGREILAHCVHLTDEDRERIADSGAGIAHCPSSNLKLGSGIADIPESEGISVGLGTDSAASNNSLNMVREGRTAALLHKRDNPDEITAQEILDMLTRDAAAVLNAQDMIGSLEEGKRADIILLDATDPTLCPSFGEEGLLSNLVYSFHGQVTMTIVDGEIVVKNGTTTTNIDTSIETVRKFMNTITSST